MPARSAARILLPLAALTAALLSLFTTVPHVVAPVIAANAAPFDVSEAEVLACQSSTGRAYDDCSEEIEGRALIRDAERLARSDLRRHDDLAGELALADETRAPGQAPRARAQ